MLANIPCVVRWISVTSNDAMKDCFTTISYDTRDTINCDIDWIFVCASSFSIQTETSYNQFLTSCRVAFSNILASHHGDDLGFIASLVIIRALEGGDLIMQGIASLELECQISTMIWLNFISVSTNLIS